MSSSVSAPVRNHAFLPHINGLRALAIVLVVLYHLEAALCPCGYFGVDVFLVISGYFIFSKELSPGRVAEMRYGSYLLRKVWRVGPPGLGVVLGGVGLWFFCVASGGVPHGHANNAVLLCGWQ